MINERTYIKEALYDWAAAVVAANGRTEEVTWRDDNGPRPMAPFISIEIVGGSRRGRPWKSLIKVGSINDEGEQIIDPDDDGVQTIMQPSKKTLTMYGFGEGAFDLLELIRDSLYLEEFKLMLGEKGLSITQAMDITGGPVEIDGVREAQPHFDFIVVFNRVFTDKPGWIEHVTIESNNLPMKPINI